MFLELIVRSIFFLSSILAKCFCDESCRGDFPPFSPKGLVLVSQTGVCVIDGDFEFVQNF